MSEYNKLLKENVICELKLCQEEFINQEQVDFAISQSMSELYNAQIQGIVAEYFLIRGDYKKAKYHHKKYREMLKDLL
jgi:hypothetical protein